MQSDAYVPVRRKSDGDGSIANTCVWCRGKPSISLEVCQDRQGKQDQPSAEYQTVCARAGPTFLTEVPANENPVS